jgi:hypothetical protein
LQNLLLSCKIALSMSPESQLKGIHYDGDEEMVCHPNNCGPETIKLCLIASAFMNNANWTFGQQYPPCIEANEGLGQGRRGRDHDVCVPIKRKYSSRRKRFGVYEILGVINGRTPGRSNRRSPIE